MSPWQLWLDIGCRQSHEYSYLIDLCIIDHTFNGNSAINHIYCDGSPVHLYNGIVYYNITVVNVNVNTHLPTQLPYNLLDVKYIYMVFPPIELIQFKPIHKKYKT